jgi:ribosomal protein L34E
MVQGKPDWQEVKPLGKVTCSSHDCEHDLHCFRRQRPVNQSYRNGRCFACGVDLIDWNRIDKKNLKDADYTIQAVQYEMIRHVYWHKTIDEHAMALARKKGLQQLRIDAEKRILKYVSPPSKENPWDGRQTPFRGNLIYYAQHGTATCCRKCAEEWHGIERNRPLTHEEIKYMVDLVMLYIRKRVPHLTE